MLIVSWRTEGRRESGQAGGRGHVSAGSAQNKARGSGLGASFKGDLVVSHLSEEVLLTFGKHFKLRQADGLAVDLCEALCEEAVAVAGDFENEVRVHLIAPRIVIEKLRIDRNLRVLLWGLGIRKRELRIQEMKTDVIDTGGSRSIGQYNHPNTLFRIVSDP
jgi:hypothetical protein